MEFFEKKISHLIQNQFPDLYNEEGQLFLEFTKKYYEWLESPNNAVYHSRRLMEYGDIDSTVDDFILYFKSKYLNSFQFNTETNTEQLVKHSLDIYRSKGSERGIDLFFKGVFGKPAKVYFPGDDMFRLSNGEWILPKYLEVSYEDNISSFIDKEIEGLDSGAKAFVEKYIRKKINGKYVELLYISSINGSFITGELIRTTGSKIIGPVIIGSLNDLTVIDGSSGYNVGDIVNIESSYGAQGKARVANTANVSGRVDFTLEDGGWGFTTNSQIIISNNLIKSDYTIVGSNNNANLTYNQFETLVQPLANISFYDLSGDMLANGDFIYTYDPSSNSYLGQGRVLTTSNSSSTNGTALVAILDGYLDIVDSFIMEDGNNFIIEQSESLLTSENDSLSDQYLWHDEANDEFDFSFSTENGNNIVIDYHGLYKLYTIETESSFEIELEDGSLFLAEEDASSSRISSYDDVSAVGNVMTSSTNTTIYITNSNISFSSGETIYQTSGISDAANGYLKSITYNGANAVLSVTNSYGIWINNSTLYSKNTLAEGIISRITIDVAVHDVKNSFISTNGNIIIGMSSNTRGTASLVGTGSGATASIGNSFLYTETIDINSDLIVDYLGLGLSLDDFGFNPNSNTNLDSVIGEALNYDSYTYGTIRSITVSGAGSGYNYVPYIFILEPSIVNLNKLDFIVNISNTSGTFLPGEVVLQSGQNKGIVKAGSNSSILYLKRITFDNTLNESFEIDLEDSNTFITEDSNTIISDQSAELVGVTSGATTEILSYYYDVDSPPAGFNSIVSSNVVTGTGKITSLDVIDSGFGYYDNEIVTFNSSNNTGEGIAKIILDDYGKSEGYYRRNDSELSSNKYIQDSDYYQEFSYEIQTAVTLDKYAGMLKNILHIAGTKPFGKFLLETVSNTTISGSTTLVVANNG